MQINYILNLKKKKKVTLITSDDIKIKRFIEQEEYTDVIYFDKWNFSISKLRSIKRYIEKYEIDTVHIEYPGDAYGKGMLINFLPLYIRILNIFNKDINVSVFLRLHEFTKARFLRRVTIIPLLIGSNRVYVPALFDFEYLKKYFGKKIIKTYIGSNILSNYDKDELLKSKESYKINLAYFGFVYHNKGIENLLNIFNEIKKKDKFNKFKFTIIGEISENKDNHFIKYHKKIISLIKQLNLENDIRITGYLEDSQVSNEIKKVDIAILPFDDGISLRRGSFLTFLTHGIPIITTKGDYECEKIFSGESGICMANNNEEIIRTIIEWSSDKKNLLERGYKNFEKSKMFSWDNIANELLKDYELKEMR